MLRLSLINSSREDAEIYTKFGVLVCIPCMYLTKFGCFSNSKILLKSLKYFCAHSRRHDAKFQWDIPDIEIANVAVASSDQMSVCLSHYPQHLRVRLQVVIAHEQSSYARPQGILQLDNIFRRRRLHNIGLNDKTWEIHEDTDTSYGVQELNNTGTNPLWVSILP